MSNVGLNRAAFSAQRAWAGAHSLQVPPLSVSAVSCRARAQGPAKERSPPCHHPDCASWLRTAVWIITRRLCGSTKIGWPRLPWNANLRAARARYV